MLNWLSYYYLYFLDWLNIIFQFQNLQWNSNFLIQVLQSYKNNSIIFNFVLRFDYFDQLTACIHLLAPKFTWEFTFFLRLRNLNIRTTLLYQHYSPYKMCIQTYEWRCFDLTEDNCQRNILHVAWKHNASFL